MKTGCLRHEKADLLKTPEIRVKKRKKSAAAAFDISLKSLFAASLQCLPGAVGEQPAAGIGGDVDHDCFRHGKEREFFPDFKIKIDSAVIGGIGDSFSVHSESSFQYLVFSDADYYSVIFPFCNAVFQKKKEYAENDFNGRG